MKRQIFILNSENGSAGVARVVNNNKKTTVTLDPGHKIPGKKDCFLVCGADKIKSTSSIKDKFYFIKDNINEIDNIFFSDTSTEKVLAWSGDDFPAKPPADNSHPDFFTFDNFFGGGFEWQRIRGNFVVYDYSIIHHILTQKSVYIAINKTGYYCAGIKKEGDLTLIAVAIIKSGESVNPFDELNTDSYTILSGKKKYIAICTGIDKTGEFFLTY